MKKHITQSIVLTCALACSLAPARAAELITNGGFESGFTGWTHADSAGSDGSFFLQTGTASPINSMSVPAPPGGATAAMTDAQAPGSHVLYQDFTITAPVGSAILSFDTYLGNQAGGFFVPDPNTLDFAVAAFNQQARVDILLGGASAFSLSADDVLLNIYQTTSATFADPGYTSHSADIAAVLNAHLNTVLRLRFAETDNVSTFQFGADNVSLATSAVPEPASFVTVGFGILLCCASLRIRRLFASCEPVGHVSKHQSFTQSGAPSRP